MSSTPIPDTAARAAAEWWGERVRNVRPETDGLHPRLTADQAFAATAWIGLRGQELDAAPVPEPVIEAFVAQLAALIARAGGDGVLLSVDYEPCPLLREAADAAGVPVARLPGKTVLRVRPDHVLGKVGYGAPWRVVWSAAGWVHPACGERDWSDGSDDPVGPECAQPRWHEGKHDWQ